MKQITILVSILFISAISFAQKKTESVKVWGNCGMCKKTIESAALKAGASNADWNAETQLLQISYKAKKSSSDRIQQAIAHVGYDTEKYTALQEVYDQLHGCCKYDRKESAAGEKVKPACCKDGKCTKDHTKESEKADCCN